jgi:peptidoglycan/LPS O-acetylase OafA/YrhL
VTAAIVILALAAHFRGWSRVVRILLGVVSAWGLAIAVAGSPRVHLLHVSLAAVITCGAMCVVGIVTLHMTRESRP